MTQPSYILLVDDEPNGLMTLEALLTNQGYHLAFARNGTEALAQAAECAPDLILLDVMMPDMDGFEVCRRLRADLHLAEVPIILLTALDDRESRLQGIEAGADDFISKPFDRVELRTRVRTITRLNRYRRLVAEREQTQRQLQRMAALRTIDQAIIASFDLRVTLNVFLDQVTNQLDVHAASLLLLDPYTHALECTAQRGFHSTRISGLRARLGEGYAGRIALDRIAIGVANLAEVADFGRAALVAQEGFVGYYGVPLIARGRVKGVLELFHRAPLQPDTDWQNFLEALASQAAIAIDNAELFTRLQRSRDELALAYDATLEGWVSALDLRDRETEGHTRRVTELTLRLANNLGVNQEELIHIRRGALLHDIGKMAIPDEILRKPGRLTPEEWEIMRRHPLHAYEWLKSVSFLRPALDIPYYHHEKWDGSGYPRGLKGEDIPLAARIFAIVDVWDALSYDRPYHTAWPQQKVREYLQEQAGKHFDPHVVPVFLSLI